jgi:hypothetical protein
MNSIEHRVEYGVFLSMESDHHQLQGKSTMARKVLSILRLRSGQGGWANVRIDLYTEFLDFSRFPDYHQTDLPSAGKFLISDRSEVASFSFRKEFRAYTSAS